MGRLNQLNKVHTYFVLCQYKAIRVNKFYSFYKFVDHNLYKNMNKIVSSMIDSLKDVKTSNNKSKYRKTAKYHT